MAEGNRLWHPNRAYWGAPLVIECQRPYPEPLWCEACDGFHINKCLHLDVDDDGFVIVSDGVLNGSLSKAIPPLAGFLFMNKVAEPPTQQLWKPVNRERTPSHHRLSKER